MAVSEPLIGRVFGERFRIAHLIARGGMGKVYKAIQIPLGRPVVVKVLDPAYTGQSVHEFHQRFFLEASLCSRLRHPNTVTIFDYGQADDIYFIVMEYLEGRTLTQAMHDDGIFRPARAVHIGMQMCRSLREAHGLGIVHRDLKPANIFLVHHDDRDEDDFVKVLDFGLVKCVSRDVAQDHLTRVGSIMGSPGYMAPEQIRGQSVDHRADVYVIGCLLFEMLAGRPVFVSSTTVGVLRAHVEDAPPALRDVLPEGDIPEALNALIQRCLAKDPAHRFANMGQVLAELKVIARSMVDLAWLANEDSAVVLRPREATHIPTDSAQAQVQALALTMDGVVMHAPTLIISPEEQILRNWQVPHLQHSAQGQSVLPIALPKPAAVLPAPISISVHSRANENDESRDEIEESDARIAYRENSYGSDQPSPSWPLRMAAFAVLMLVCAGAWELWQQRSRAGLGAQGSIRLLPNTDAARSVVRLEIDLVSQPAGAIVLLDNTKICDATPCSIVWMGNPDIVKESEAAGELKRFHFLLPDHQQVQLQKQLSESNRLALHAVLDRT